MFTYFLYTLRNRTNLHTEQPQKLNICVFPKFSFYRQKQKSVHRQWLNQKRKNYWRPK